MCHIYECPNCHEISAQVFSFQYQDVWRYGVDIYDCDKCGKRMIVETDMDKTSKPHEYSGDRKELLERYVFRMLLSMGKTQLEYKINETYWTKLSLFQEGIERTNRKRARLKNDVVEDRTKILNEVLRGDLQ